ncbi:MAG: trigger factor [Firmicutes bacterium]|nr:trigger factor [Bacillota bacterium]
MNQVEQLGNSMVKVTLEISPEQFEKAMEIAYNKNKKQISVPGFRKGKAPRKMVEKMYGKEIFYEDAINAVLPEMYDEAVKELNLDVMSRPEVSVDSIEEGKSVVVTCEVAVKPEVTLGEYKGLEVEAEDATVTEEDVNAEIERIANRNARMVEVTDRAAQMDDILTIDFEGFMDGVAFAGGKGENHDLKLGSHSFIDTFEDQLVGKNVGDECEVNVTFPAEYHQKDLAGKPAMFKVAVKAIKFNEVPEINDEFVKEVSEFDTLDEYKADTKKNLEERKAKQVEESRKAKLLSKVVETSTMDMPEPMVLEQCDQMINNFAQTLRYQGMDMQKYMEMTGSTIDTMRQSVRSEAERRLKESLVLEAIAKAENLEATDEDVEKELETMASMYGMEVEKLKAAVTEAETESIKGELKTKKALEFIAENAKA